MHRQRPNGEFLGNAEIRDVLSTSIYGQRRIDFSNRELHPFLQHGSVPKTTSLHDTDGISLYLCSIRNSRLAAQQGGNITEYFVFSTVYLTGGTSDSTFSSIFGKSLLKPIVVINRIREQDLKTAVSLAFSVFSELHKAIIQPGASWWGRG